MLIKRIRPMSLGKILGALYGICGLFLGLIFALVSLAIPSLGSSSPQAAFPGASLFFGVGSIIFLPIFYGVLGFVGGVICAALYNGLAKFVGGVVLDVE